MPRRARKAKPQDSGQVELVLTRPEDRATLLGLERDRLLKEIRRRRKEVDRIEREIEAAKAESFAKVGPLVEQQARVEQVGLALDAVALCTDVRLSSGDALLREP